MHTWFYSIKHGTPYLILKTKLPITKAGDISQPFTIYGSLNTGISVLNSLFNISSIPCINPIPSIPCYSQFCVRSYLSINIDAPNHTKEYIDDVSLYANIIKNLLCLISPWYFTRVKYAKPYGIRQIFVCLAICAPEYLLSITWPINPLANDRLVLLAPPWLHELAIGQ